MTEASLSASLELLASTDGSIVVASNAVAELVVSNILPSAESVPTRPTCQPATTAAVAPTPIATKNTSSTPATYIKYLNGGESALIHSIISSPALRPHEYILVARGRKEHPLIGLFPLLR